MAMKAHAYYIIFGRPPIGGGSFPLPLPPGGATDATVASWWFVGSPRCPATSAAMLSYLFARRHGSNVNHRCSCRRQRSAVTLAVAQLVSREFSSHERS